MCAPFARANTGRCLVTGMPTKAIVTSSNAPRHRQGQVAFDSFNFFQGEKEMIF
jgi:hypothetical protein